MFELGIQKNWIDALCARKGYSNRSEAIRDLIRPRRIRRSSINWARPAASSVGRA